MTQILLILLIALLFSSTREFQQEMPFCYPADHEGSYTEIEDIDCQACPANSYCLEGKIAYCQKPFVLFQETCIPEDQHYQRTKWTSSDVEHYQLQQEKIFNHFLLKRFILSIENISLFQVELTCSTIIIKFIKFFSLFKVTQVFIQEFRIEDLQITLSISRIYLFLLKIKLWMIWIFTRKKRF